MELEITNTKGDDMNSLMEYTPKDVQNQVQNIQHLKETVLIDKEHYGVIPGCGTKPALLKAGAEKLAFMFRLAPKFTISKTELKDGHREYEISCELTHIPTGQYIGAGMGICSTMETKYRYRSDKASDVMTDIQVPKTYWDRKKAGATGPDLQYILAQQVGEPGKYGTKKDANDQWVIVKRGESTGEKVENPDIADTYNTVIKMAKKRAYVDAVITCTAASDFFTQDIEETATDYQEAKVTESVAQKQEIKILTEPANILDFITSARTEQVPKKGGGTATLYVFTTSEHGDVCTWDVKIHDAAKELNKCEGGFILSVEPNGSTTPFLKAVSAQEKK